LEVDRYENVPNGPLNGLWSGGSETDGACGIALITQSLSFTREALAVEVDQLPSWFTETLVASVYGLLPPYTQTTSTESFVLPSDVPAIVKVGFVAPESPFQAGAKKGLPGVVTLVLVIVAPAVAEPASDKSAARATARPAVLGLKHVRDTTTSRFVIADSRNFPLGA
jgi:hypothetical protein